VLNLDHDLIARRGVLGQGRNAHEQRNVREAHEAVGREILRVLDRHYATLVRTFGHQPAAPIPVILLSSQSYYDATGAPFWSCFILAIRWTLFRLVRPPTP